MEPSNSTPKSVLIHRNHERCLTRVEVAIEHINATLQDIKTEIKTMGTDIRHDFKWLLTIILGTSASILGVIGHIQHWV